MAIDEKNTIKDILLNIDARISHIEDLVSDHRSCIVKLVKQGNQIVSFLKELEIESINDVDITYEPLNDLKQKDIDRSEKIQKLVDEFINQKKDLKEFEEELKKNKDKLTPGQVGEA